MPVVTADETQGCHGFNGAGENTGTEVGAGVTELKESLKNRKRNTSVDETVRGSRLLKAGMP